MDDKKEIKVLCITTKNFNNEYKIKDTLHKLSKYKDSLVISTPGKDENYLYNFIYKTSVMFNYRYREFPVYHNQYTADCILPRWKYNKPWNAKNFNIRDRDAVKWADRVFVFINKMDLNSSLESLIKFIKKEDERKCYIFFN